MNSGVWPWSIRLRCEMTVARAISKFTMGFEDVDGNADSEKRDHRQHG